MDSEAGYDRATCAALTALGFTPNPSIRMNLVGLPLAACEAPLVTEYGPSFPWREFVLNYQHHAQFLPPLPSLKYGVQSALRRLRRAGKKIGFATNGTDSNARAVLHTYGLLEHGDALVTQNDVQHRKPDPDIYLIAASKLHEPSSRLVAVEDSLAGLKAAKSAGMFAALVPDLSLTPPDWNSAADGTFTSVTQLVDVVLGLGPRQPL